MGPAGIVGSAWLRCFLRIVVQGQRVVKAAVVYQLCWRINLFRLDGKIGIADQAIAALIRASAALAVAFTASRFPRMPAVEYASSMNMSNWLLSTSG